MLFVAETGCAAAGAGFSCLQVNRYTVSSNVREGQRRKDAPIRALCSPSAVSLRKERADVSPVPAIVRVRLRHRLQHLLASRARPDRRRRACAIRSRVGQLALHVLGVVFCRAIDGRAVSILARRPLTCACCAGHDWQHARLLMSDVGASFLRPRAISRICDGRPNSLQGGRAGRIWSARGQAASPTAVSVDRDYAQVKNARRADITDLGAGIADLCLLEATLPGVPAKDGDYKAKREFRANGEHGQARRLGRPAYQQGVSEYDIHGRVQILQALPSGCFDIRT